MAIHSANQYTYTGRAPLDSKSLVKTYAELISKDTWQVKNSSGKDVVIAYNGMIAAVWLDKDENKNLTNKNGIYFLFDSKVTGTLSAPDVTNEANWHKLAEVSDLIDKLATVDARLAALEQDSAVLTYAYRSGFPATGELNKLYVAIDEGKSYVWSNDQYLLISGSGDYEEPTVIYGGSAD